MIRQVQPLRNIIILAARCVALLLMAAFVPATKADAQPFTATHYAELTSANETSPVISPAMGLALLDVERDSNLVHYTVTVIDLSGTITSAGFYLGSDIQDGTPLKSITFAAGKHTASGTLSNLSSTEISAFTSGNVYLQVMTSANPTGEIRAQVYAFENAGSILRPRNEVPPVDASDGSADATFIVDAAAKALYYSLEWSDLTGQASGIKLVKGGEGVAGTTIQTIPLVPYDSTGGWISGELTGLSDQDIAAIISGNAYINIETATYPGGEIRGQIYPVNYYTSGITLGSTSELVGAGYIRSFLDAHNAEMQGYFLIDGTDDAVNEAHVHLKPDGETAVELNSGATLNEWDIFYFTDSDTVRAWEQRGMYADFHTSRNPNGAASGDLKPAASNLGQVQVAAAPMQPVLSPAASFTAWYDRSAGALTFHLPDGSLPRDASVTLYSPLGEQVATAGLDEAGMSMMVGSLPSGVYFARLTSPGMLPALCRIPIVR